MANSLSAVPESAVLAIIAGEIERYFHIPLEHHDEFGESQLDYLENRYGIGTRSGHYGKPGYAVYYGFPADAVEHALKNFRWARSTACHNRCCIPYHTVHIVGIR